MTTLNAILAGAITMASLVIALFFLRFWKTSRDRFFLYLALSFVLQALARFALESQFVPAESHPIIYLLRLAAYALILVAIIDKNRRRTVPSSSHKIGTHSTTETDS